MKHILLSFIALFATANLYAYDFKSGNLCYNIIDGGSNVEITYDVFENSSYAGVIHIPATVTNGTTTYPVVAIGEKAFYKSKVTDIHIPNTIGKIGKQAFRNSDKLVNITLPIGITSLPEYMLEGTHIAAIAIPDGVTEIGSGAFQACPQLTSVFLPSQLKKILSYGFYACHSLTEIYTLAATPPTATAFAVFQGLDAFDVIVPQNSVSAYESTEPWNKFSIYPEEEFSMSMTVQGQDRGDYDEISLGSNKAYKIYYQGTLLAVTAAESYYIPNDGTSKTYQIVPSNYFYDATAHNYTTISHGAVSDATADDIVIRAIAGEVHIDGNIFDKNVEIYDVYGALRYNGVAKPVISLDATSQAIYIVKCGSKVSKVIL